MKRQQKTKDFQEALLRAKMIAVRMNANKERALEQQQRLMEEHQAGEIVDQRARYGLHPTSSKEKKTSELKIPTQSLDLFTQKLLTTLGTECNVIIHLVNGDPDSIAKIAGSDLDIAYAKCRMFELMTGSPPPEGMFTPQDEAGAYTIYVQVPVHHLSLVIGDRGSTMKEIQDATNAKVSISREGESDPNVHSRTVILTGTEETVAKAQKMINDLLQDGDAKGASVTELIKVPNDKVGLVIGKGGDTIKTIQNECNVKLTIDTAPDASGERPITITGSYENVQIAKDAIYDRVAGRRGRGFDDDGYGYTFQTPSYDYSAQYAAQGQEYAANGQYDPAYAQAYQAYAYDPQAYAATGEQPQFDYNSKEYAEYYAQYMAQQGFTVENTTTEPKTE